MTNQHKRWKTALLTAAWLVGFAVVCHAQQPFLYKYGIENGLPFPEADGINFTKNGEAWVRYSSGEVLSRFDGINWTHYRLDELGLPLGLAFATEDEHGFWFQSGRNDEWWVARITPNREWKKYHFEGRVSVYFSQPDGRLILMDEHFFAYQYDKKTDRFLRSDKPLFVSKTKEVELFEYANNISDGSLYLITRIPSENKLMLHYGEDFQYSVDVPVPYFLPTYMVGKDLRGIYTKDGQWHWWNGKMGWTLEVTLPNGRKGKHVRGARLNYFGGIRDLTSTNGLVIEDPIDGVFYLYGFDSAGTAQLLLSHLPKDIFWDACSQDKHGNWWYGTSSGLVRSEQSQLVFNENTSGMITGLHALDEDAEGNIWMGGYTGSGGFTVYDGDRLQRKFFTNESMPVLPGTYRNTSGTLYFFVEAPAGIMAIRNGQPTYIDIKINELGHTTVGFHIQPLRNGQIALGLAAEGIGIATETNGLINSIKTIGKRKGMLLDNVLTVSEDEGGRLWAGRSSQGVAVYDPQRDTAITWLRSPEVSKSVGMMASCVDENGTLWLGTNDGVYLLRNAHQFDYLHENLFDHFEKMPLPGGGEQRIHSIKNIPDYLVIGTPQGVYFYDKKYRGERPRIFSMIFGKDISGGGAEQNAVLLDSKGYLWVGTQEGATRIDLKNLRFDTSATTLRLERFTAGDAEIPVADAEIGQLPVKKRNITFAFSPSGSAFLKDDLFYDIAVVNAQGDTLFWRSQTKERKGELPYLPKGKYTLHISAYKHNVLSGQAAFGFVVPMLASENPLVWVGLALMVLGIPFAFFYQRKRHQAELEKSKRERDALQIRALSNFFNPHFINNALHWVQSRYRKDPDTALIVGRLSDNVDLLFANTQVGRAYHPLATELEIVQNYLKIQQVRFSDGLAVSLDLPQGEAGIGDLSVPAMLLQIHAENAVEKGIRNRKGAGQFLLSVKLEGDGCRITIEDDGRGRPMENGGSSNGRKGSTAVMDDLISLFNRYNSKPLTVQYEDLIFGLENEEQYGTSVHIFIPKNYNYELS